MTISCNKHCNLDNCAILLTAVSYLCLTCLGAGLPLDEVELVCGDLLEPAADGVLQQVAADGGVGAGHRRPRLAASLELLDDLGGSDRGLLDTIHLLRAGGAALHSCCCCCS